MSSRCENCKLRKAAAENPASFKSKLWHWHTKWCPGWKAYQAELKKKENQTINN